MKGQLITLAAKLLELQALSFSAVLTRTIILAATSTAFKRHHDSLLTLGHFFFPSGIMALPIIKYTIKPGTKPVATIKISAIIRTQAGSVSKYSAIPPATPRAFLSLDNVSSFFFIIAWSHPRDLNPRPLPYHGSALPLS